MASVASLREHLVEELNDLLNAEQQLTEALPQMAERASSHELRTAIRSPSPKRGSTPSASPRRSNSLARSLGKTCEAMEGSSKKARS